MSRQSITVRLPPKLAARLATKAKKERRARSVLVRDALERYLASAQKARPYELVEDLVGSFQGPGDLSSKKVGALPKDRPAEEQPSFLEAARDLAGCIDGPPDLSTRKPTFVEMLRASPLVGVELDILRDRRQVGNAPVRSRRRRHK